MSKRYKVFWILSIVIAICGSIIALGRAIYVIANGLVQIDAAPYNPIYLFTLALIGFLTAYAFFSSYKVTKEIQEKIALLKEMLENSQANSDDTINQNDKHNVNNDSNTNSKHYHDL